MTAQEALCVGYVNQVVPREGLKEETNEVARTMALMEMDFLTLHKRAINRFFEVAGLKTCVNTGVELDALMHTSEASQRIGAEFNKTRKEQGLKAALTWRDAGYSDGRTVSGAAQPQEEKEKKG